MTDQPAGQPQMPQTGQPDMQGGPCMRCVLGAVAGSLVAIWMLLITYRGARGLGRLATRGLRQPDR